MLKKTQMKRVKIIEKHQLMPLVRLKTESLKPSLTLEPEDVSLPRRQETAWAEK